MRAAIPVSLDNLCHCLLVEHTLGAISCLSDSSDLRDIAYVAYVRKGVEAAGFVKSRWTVRLRAVADVQRNCLDDYA